MAGKVCSRVWTSGAAALCRAGWPLFRTTTACVIGTLKFLSLLSAESPALESPCRGHPHADRASHTSLKRVPRSVLKGLAQVRNRKEAVRLILTLRIISNRATLQQSQKIYHALNFFKMMQILNSKKMHKMRMMSGLFLLIVPRQPSTNYQKSTKYHQFRLSWRPNSKMTIQKIWDFRGLRQLG